MFYQFIGTLSHKDLQSLKVLSTIGVQKVLLGNMYEEQHNRKMHYSDTFLISFFKSCCS